MNHLPVVDIRAARSGFDAETRLALLTVAAKILGDEGPAALTIRRLAETVNTSTKAIYTHFGGKDGLLDAIYVHSFAGLTESFEVELIQTEPIDRLRCMIAAYRRFALSEPALYSVMFGDLGRSWEPALGSRRQAWRSFETFRSTVAQYLVAAGTDDAHHVTHLLWSAMHGVVSLEMRKVLGPGVDGSVLFNAAIDAVFAQCDLPGPASKPDGTTPQTSVGRTVPVELSKHAKPLGESGTVKSCVSS